MKINQFPWLALGLGLLFALIILQTDGHIPGSTSALPLLMRLLMSEFAFLLNAAGLVISVREMLRHGLSFSGIALATGCLLLAGFFFYLGILLWPVQG
ncbi:MAG: hypothetical protein R3179_01140 [Sedimenticolaceae bacterium]|nr:hypothetical protein [Sedimenticolaceae bacterium]